MNLKKGLRKDLIFGNTWKDYVKDVEESNYDRKFIKKLYNGNLCLDFGSKWDQRHCTQGLLKLLKMENFTPS